MNTFKDPELSMRIGSKTFLRAGVANQTFQLCFLNKIKTTNPNALLMAPVELKPGMPARRTWLGGSAPMDQKELTPWLRLPDVINLIMLETLCQKQQLSSDRIEAKLLFLTIISRFCGLLFLIALFIIKH